MDGQWALCGGLAGAGEREPMGEVGMELGCW